jgi:hypothetical protein
MSEYLLIEEDKREDLEKASELVIALGELAVVGRFGTARFPSPLGLSPPTELSVDLSHR